MSAYSEASKAVFEVFERHDAAGRGALDRRGVPRRRADCAASSGTPTEIAPSPARATCSSRSGCRSRSAWRAPSSSPRSRAASPSPTVCSSCRPTASWRSCTRCPVERLWGVGPVTAEKLHDRGINTVGEVARARRGRARRRCSGRARAATCTRLAHNRDPRPVQVGRRRGSIGSQHALGRRPVAPPKRSTRRRRARRSGDPPHARRVDRVGRTVVLRLRFDDFSRVTRSHTLPRHHVAHADDPRHGARAPRWPRCR